MKNSKRFKIVDALYLILAILPLVVGMVLKILFTPASEGVDVKGAMIYFTIPMPIQPFPVTESQLNSLFVILTIFFLCLYFTHGLKVNPDLKRQHIAEWIVEKCESLVDGNMGEYFHRFAPFIAGMIGLSIFSSLLSLIGLYPATSDINIVAGWAILVFILITYYKFKCGPWNYLKSFGDPVPLLAPLNIISEFATPLSMAFRHYGNVLSGSVISVLLASALSGLSSMLLAFLPGFLSEIPLFQVGIPAVLSIYFDVFSGCLQAYIFAMLTMLYVSGGFNMDLYFERKEKKKARRESKRIEKLRFNTATK